MKQPKEPVRLRQRKMPSGNVSLYLDIYVNGQRKYEYLKLYLSPSNGRAERERNRETLRLAEDIRAKRLVEIRNGLYGFRDDGGAAAHVQLVDFFEEMCKKKDKVDSHATYRLWKSVLRNLEVYLRGRSVSLATVDAAWLRGYKDWLQGLDLAQNTKAHYFDVLCTCLYAAQDAGVIHDVPIRKAGGRMRKEEAERNYLTLDELRKLAGTPCRNDAVRRAFLFSCLTGLRLSDIEKLLWGDVKTQGLFTRIFFRQKKTGGMEYTDISAEAAVLLGERDKDIESPFNMPSRATIGVVLQQWVSDAGIEKHITFHCGRHTFAVMMLDLGTDIYTVSKLLGHKELATTQIYARVLDKNKQAAVQRIPSILGGGVSAVVDNAGEGAGA